MGEVSKGVHMTKKQGGLLRRYANSVGGVIFTSIAVGKRSIRGHQRYTDGVRVIPPGGAAGKVEKLHPGEFKKLVKGRTVEAIEVDEYLNRLVIGRL